MAANPDFRDLFSAFNTASVRDLLAGGYAGAFHAEPRFTKGLDVWIEASPSNAQRDLAGWRRERLPAVPDTAAFTLAPDWVCEIVSPSTERLDRARKMLAYAREGVIHLWIVNPALRTLEVCRLAEERWLLVAIHEGAAQVRAEPFDAVELDLAPLWGEEP